MRLHEARSRLIVETGRPKNDTKTIPIGPNGIGFVRGSRRIIEGKHEMRPLPDPTDLGSMSGGERPSREKITEAVRKIVAKMGGDPRSINAGDCDTFALALIKELEFGDAEEILAEEEDEGYIPSHAWARIDGRYYDAEAPDGVDRWQDLPIFRRWYSNNPEE